MSGKTKPLVNFFLESIKKSRIPERKISMIVPIRKVFQEDFSRTINSINAITDKNFELIFVLDGEDSDWYTEPAISPEINHNIIVSAKVAGPSVARNIGVTSSSGDIITYMDIGDEINSEKIEMVKRVFSDYPNFQLLFTAYSLQHPSAGLQEFKPQEKFNALIKNNKSAKKLLKYGGVVPALGIAHVRKPFYLAGGFQPGIESGEEGILWRRMADFCTEEMLASTDFNSGTKHTQKNDKKEYACFSIESKLNSNGQHLDKAWYSEYSSGSLMVGEKS